jgi:hypothetical protein
MHVLILILWVLAACSSAPKAAQATRCREQGLAVIEAAGTCREAKAGLERLVERSPECAAILNDDAGAGVHCKGADQP